MAKEGNPRRLIRYGAVGTAVISLATLTACTAEPGSGSTGAAISSSAAAEPPLGNPNGSYLDIATNPAGVPPGLLRHDGTPSWYKKTTEDALVRNPKNFPGNVCFNAVSVGVEPGVDTDASFPTTKGPSLSGLYLGLTPGSHYMPGIISDSPPQYSSVPAVLTLANARAGHSAVPEILCGSVAQVPPTSELGKQLIAHNDPSATIFGVDIVDFTNGLPPGVTVNPTTTTAKFDQMPRQHPTGHVQRNARFQERPQRAQLR